MNRRSLILGLGSLVLAPSIVRASSLMSIRGEAMDPWVLCGRAALTGGVVWDFESMFHDDSPPFGQFPTWKRMSLDDKINYLNVLGPLVKYRKARRSELGVVA